MIDARKVRFGKSEAVALARAKANRVIAANGQVDLKKSRTGDEELATLLLGPTGNLKAPTILVGKSLVIGFLADEYRRLLG